MFPFLCHLPYALCPLTSDFCSSPYALPPFRFQLFDFLLPPATALVLRSLTSDFCPLFAILFPLSHFPAALCPLTSVLRLLSSALSPSLYALRPLFTALGSSVLCPLTSVL